MIGNDVVDLLKAAQESNWKRNGYLHKIFTTQEQHLIHHAEDADLLVWLIWSMKESAYKIINRSTGIRNYTPLRFSCTNVTLNKHEATGEVHYQDIHCFTKTDILPGFIHSVATLSANDFTAIQVCNQPFTANYLTAFNQSQSTYLLSKNKTEIPELTHLRTGQKHAVSISHHGRHLAIAYSDSPLSTN